MQFIKKLQGAGLMRTGYLSILGAVFLFIMTFILTGQNCMAAGYVIPAEDFEYIPAGTFFMGSSSYPDEDPVHTVTISNAFGMQKHEVTQKQWAEVMNKGTDIRPWLNADGTPKKNVVLGDDFPAVCISWDDAQAFITRLNSNAGTNTNIFRLPTEAEWEYACRAGTTTAYFFGDSADMLGNYTWYTDNSDSKYHKIELKKPNPWCLYDMYGNVWERCSDWWDPDYYASSPQKNPQGPNGPLQGRVARGGSFLSNAWACRSSRRAQRSESNVAYDLGFRLVRTDVQPRKPAFSDLVPVLQVCAGMDNTICLLHGDVNNDGHIDLMDAIAIFQTVSGQRD